MGKENMGETKNNRNPYKNNPYVIGRPIEEPDKFFGREGLFQVIEDNLRQNVQLILLYGQRRIGKSSVLKQIPKKVAREDFVFVNFDIQGTEQLPRHEILHRIASGILEALELNEQVVPPSAADLENNIAIFSQQFLPEVYQQLGNKNLVLLLDEFDVLSEANSGSDSKEFFNSIKSLLRRQQRLFIIPVVGRHLNELKNLRTFFREAPYKEIAVLDEDSAQRLITRPAQGVLKYEPEAIPAILKLSAGHPFFTQVICFTLFAKARERNQWTITRVDVEGIVDRVFQDENALAGLAWFWDGLPIPEQVVLSAVAEAQKRAIEQSQRLPEEPLTLLSSYGVIPTESLIEAAQQLADNGFLDDTGRRVKVELVRRWLVQSHPLKQEIRELEKLDQENVNKLLSVADNFSQQGKTNALQLYEQALELNPNHFTAIMSLAQAYLQVENFDKVLELYNRAYKFDPRQNKEQLLHVRETYGHKLIIQREYGRAREQFETVLQIDTNRLSARQKLKEIEAYESGISNVTKPPRNNLRRQQIIRGSITAAIVAAITLPIGVFIIYSVSVSCPAGEEKNLGFFCKTDTNIISRGERTLYPQIKNNNRDQGIQAFKQGNYKDAIQFFEKAVAANRNDPEVLIYYNNARAHDQGFPITFAVAVPVAHQDSNDQEILRGVAQAQNQFNKQGGINNRLLEIVIGNDANDKNQAKQLATQLAEDTSIIGVIGHNASDSTEKALTEYEKAGIAVISPTSTSTSLKHGKVFFRTVPSDALAGKKLADYAWNKLKIKKVFIFYNSQSNYSKSIKDAFEDTFQQAKERFDWNEISNSNLSSLLSTDRFQNQPEAIVLFPGSNDTDKALEVAKQTQETSTPNSTKLGLKLLGGDAFYSNTTLTKGEKAVEGLILAVPWFREAAKSQNFAEQAKQLWGGDVSWRTATSYDATQVLIKSLSPNPSRTTIIQRLQNVNLSADETSGEPLQFTQGERQSQPVLVQVKDGNFVKLE